MATFLFGRPALRAAIQGTSVTADRLRSLLAALPEAEANGILADAQTGLAGGVRLSDYVASRPALTALTSDPAELRAVVAFLVAAGGGLTVERG